MSSTLMIKSPRKRGGKIAKKIMRKDSLVENYQLAPTDFSFLALRRKKVCGRSVFPSRNHIPLNGRKTAVDWRAFFPGKAAQIVPRKKRNGRSAVRKTAMKNEKIDKGEKSVEGKQNIRDEGSRESRTRKSRPGGRANNDVVPVLFCE